MYISKINFIENLHLNSNIAAVLSTLDYKELRSAILNDRPELLTKLKGIDEKTAKRIIAVGKDLIAPRKARCNIGHYSAPMFSLVQMLDDRQQALLNEASECRNVYEAHRILLNLMGTMEMESGPLHVSGEPEYNSLPQSMLSDILGIVPGMETNKISIFKFDIRLSTILSEDALHFAKKSIKEMISSVCNSIRDAVVARAVEFGFITSAGVKYTFYTCSPGQLKKQSGYWMESGTFKKHQATFWGGLTPSTINANTGFKLVDGKLTGGKGIAMTKILQYRALLTSSAVRSSKVIGKPIRLRNLICIGEFEKNMTAEVLSVDSTYHITQAVRNDIANNMFDGMIILDSEKVGNSMLQVRDYAIKGLGVPCPWGAYAAYMGYDQREDCWLVTDIDGVVHDLRKETYIYGIANTSVFKMAKMYGSWKKYVECMEALGLDELYVCAVNEEHEETKRLSRQMAQSLFSLNRDQMEYLASDTIATLHRYSDLKFAESIMGETDRDYDRRTNLGKLVSVYPEMLSESCVQKDLKDRYTKQYNSAMCGELNVNGKYYFVAADPCAWMDIVFGKRAIDDPTIGWLKANECRCDAYPEAQELIVLRSPHAFMEWATLRQAKKCPFLPSLGIYTSVHDLTFRILQMDYDGDHLLVVDDPTLVSIVKKTKEQYKIPVVYYEPDVAPNPGPMPSKPHEFSQKICECIAKCAEYNKVGQYSNLVTAAWSTYRPDMSEEALRTLLHEIAIIAAGINHAVDAQKTYHLDFLEERAGALVDKYTFKPFNDRFKNASQARPSSDEKWDDITVPKMEGVVDRMGDVVSSFADNHLELDTSVLTFDWRMLKHPDERFGKQLNQACIEPELVQAIEKLGRTKNEFDLQRIEKMKRGERIGFAEFLPLLKYLNSAFFESFKAYEDDTVEIASTNDMRNKILRRIIVDFVRHSKAAEGMNESELEILAATAALKMAYNAKKHSSGYGDMRRFIFDVFGDIYAECVLMNIANKYDPTMEDEPEFVFTADAYEVPPQDDNDFAFDQQMLFDELMVNELGDIC